MSRRRAAEKREPVPDPKYRDAVVSKFISCLMFDGKKSTAEHIVYGALEKAEARAPGWMRSRSSTPPSTM